MLEWWVLQFHSLPSGTQPPVSRPCLAHVIHQSFISVCFQGLVVPPRVHARSSPSSAGHSLTSVCVLLSSLPTSALGRTLTSQLLWECFPFVGAPQWSLTSVLPHHCNHQIARLGLFLTALWTKPRFLTSFLSLEGRHQVLTVQFLPCFPSGSHCVPAQAHAFLSFWAYTL